VTWSSSNPSFATVNSTGIVTAVGPGNVTITASASGNISSSVALQVSPRPIPPIPSYSVGTNPSGIAIDSNGNIWVTNQGDNTVTELCGSSMTNCPAGLITGSPIVTPPFQVGGTNPSGIAIDNSGNLRVLNQGSGTVSELIPSGTPLGAPLTVGTNPSSIIIDSFGSVWVTNQGNSTVSGTVSEFNYLGTSLGTFSNSKVPSPSSIAIDAAGNAWVADMVSSTVLELNTLGAVVGGPFTNGINKPSSIAIDPSGNVWVTNQGDNSITELNSGG